jgi:SAM-dependent methyltransferase
MKQLDRGEMDNPLYSASQREAWDDRYRIKGRQWGNAPVESPHEQENGVILELGVGDGKNIRARNIQNQTLIGLDFSIEALLLCKKDPTIQNTSLVLADVSYLPFSLSSIDQVFAHHILGHLPESQQTVFMSEILKILKPGGRLILTVFGYEDMRRGKGREIEPSTYIRGDGIITRYYSHEDIESLHSGFDIIRIENKTWPFRVRGKEFKRSLLTAIMERPRIFF